MINSLDSSIQIEETWARRLVTEPHRNTERRAEWEALKDIWRLWPSEPMRREGGTGIVNVTYGPMIFNIGGTGGAGETGKIRRIYP